MGAHHSSTGTAPSEPIGNDGEYPIDQHTILQQYKVEHRLFPGSGRMMKTYQLQHKSNEATAVMKAMWVDVSVNQPQPQSSSTTNAANNSNASGSTPLTKSMLQLLQEQQEELQRIKQALHNKPHMAPFSYWAHQTEFFANSAHTLLRNPSMQPVYLVRPHLYTTLSDRLASRPFFTAIEKVWMTHQLLQALQVMHSHKVCHGFLTTENVGLTSWNWLVLCDISSYKANTTLPDDDPSEYLFYFQDHHHHDEPTNIISSSILPSNNSGIAEHSGTTDDPYNDSNNLNNNNNNNNAIHATTSHDFGGGRKVSSRNREKRCYMAPERFVSTTTGTTSTDKTDTMMGSSMTTPCSKHNQLTPAMDIFSAGCVMMELWLNGDRALDLGDLMAYRRQGTMVPQLLQKLNKIESSALRAACKHMVQLDPSQRLSARAYLERLQASDEAVPKVMEACLEPLLQRISDPRPPAQTNAGSSGPMVLTPDARLALAAAHYEEVVWETLGVKDPQGVAYLKQVLGPAVMMSPSDKENITTNVDNGAGTMQETPHSTEIEKGGEQQQFQSSEDLFAETEALLKKLDSLTLFDGDEEKTDKNDSLSSPSSPSRVTAETPSSQTNITVKRSDACKSSLLIYLQLILASIRHVRHPTSKVVALQMLTRMCDLCGSDEVRLQRMVPVSIALLQDQDALVRASALKFLTHVVSKVHVFSPSDSKIFPQYIFKRVSPLLTDPSLVVRLAFSQSISVLAETAQRFLDISHAVRLYEALGGGGSSVIAQSASSGSLTISDDASSTKGKTAAKKSTAVTTSPNVFGDDVAKLLGDDSPANKEEEEDTNTTGDDTLTQQGGAFHGGGNLASSPSGKTLINSNYQEELAALQETVSRWVVHITTDPSEHSSPTKRALLDSNLSRLCTFFGLEGVMAFILPQILSFLNDRKDTQLRTALFNHLPAVCRIVGRAATEHFVLPCLESGLVDGEAQVVGSAIRCLAELVGLGLISRSVLLGNLTVTNTPDSKIELTSDGMLRKYSALLVHPSAGIRHGAIATVNASCMSLGSPDSEVYVAHLLHPYLRFQPSLRHLQSPEGMETCLYPAWTFEKFNHELQAIVNASQQQPVGPWTSVGIKSTEQSSATDPSSDATAQSGTVAPKSSGTALEVQVERVQEYLRMLGRRIRQPTYSNKNSDEEDKMGSSPLKNSIEGSLKLAQNIKFPRQDAISVNQRTLPLWYSALRDNLKEIDTATSETAAIRSVSVLGQIFGLSIMAASDGAAELVNSTAEEKAMSDKETQDLANSEESKVIEAVCSGEWGAETQLDPALMDTSLLITKLKALKVPPLPPGLGDLKAPRMAPHTPAQTPRTTGKDTTSFGGEWKPKADTLIASSSPVTGHTAPVVRIAVSLDQAFFVTGSYDGTCRVWEMDQIESSPGILDSSITYTGHSDGHTQNKARINDLAMVEGSHSVVSGASNGAVHVWRVDCVSQTKPNSLPQSDLRASATRSRVVGSSEVRQIDPSEGEILAVSHFNSPSASVVTFASQKGSVHSWDLRSSVEPFVLKHGPDIGYLTSMALGTDRNWILTGTSRGFLALWDLRFNQTVKLWHHSRGAPITRLATSFVPPPQMWGSRNLDASSVKPFVFASCGPNECGMFDVSTGDCNQCFRTVGYGSRQAAAHAYYAEDLPKLEEVPISAASTRRSALMTNGFLKSHTDGSKSSPSPLNSINAMCGSIGVGDNSYLLTGGGDARIRFWDFAVPSKCFVVSGQPTSQARPSFERVDLNGGRCRLMTCRQMPSASRNMGGAASSSLSTLTKNKLGQALAKPENHHTEAIHDLKIVNKAVISASRDCTVKVWR